MHRIEDIKTIHGGWGRFYQLAIRSATGAIYHRQLEDHGPAVSVLPYDPERGLITLVRQPRVGPLFLDQDPMLLEAPAGLTDGEDPAHAGTREVLEETGLKLATLEPLGAFWSMPGCATEKMHCYLAAYSAADKVADGGGLAHENEDIEVVELSIPDALAMVDDGRIADMKTVYLIQALRLARPEIF